MVMGMVTSFSEINNYAIVNYDYDHNILPLSKILQSCNEKSGKFVLRASSCSQVASSIKPSMHLILNIRICLERACLIF